MSLVKMRRDDIFHREKGHIDTNPGSFYNCYLVFYCWTILHAVVLETMTAKLPTTQFLLGILEQNSLRQGFSSVCYNPEQLLSLFSTDRKSLGQASLSFYISCFFLLFYKIVKTQTALWRFPSEFWGVIDFILCDYMKANSTNGSRLRLFFNSLRLFSAQKL